MKKVMVILMIAVFAMLSAGCNKLACERVAECVEGDFDVDQCVEDVREEDASCARAFRSYARCLNREDCDDSACSDEIEKMMDECPY